MTVPQKTVTEDVWKEKEFMWFMCMNWARDTEKSAELKATVVLACCFEEGTLTVYRFFPTSCSHLCKWLFCTQFLPAKQIAFITCFQAEPSVGYESWFIMNFLGVTFSGLFLKIPFTEIILNKIININDLFHLFEALIPARTFCVGHSLPEIQ